MKMKKFKSYLRWLALFIAIDWGVIFSHHLIHSEGFTFRYWIVLIPSSILLGELCRFYIKNK